MLKKNKGRQGSLKTASECYMEWPGIYFFCQIFLQTLFFKFK